jgi:hypothetical protein
MTVTADPKKNRSRKPQTLVLVPERVPTELKTLRQWVRWRWEWDERRGTWTKVPIHRCRNQKAATDNSQSWGSFEEVFGNLGKHGVDGVGFVFTVSDPYCGIDLDGCRDLTTETLRADAVEIIGGFASYTEMSATGGGAHIIVKATLPKGAGRHRGWLEVYDRGRYFAFTGAVIGTAAAIEARQADVDAFLARHFAEETQRLASGGSAVLSDGELIAKATSAKNGAKFGKLYAGDFSDYSSQSEADAALCALLAFWTSKDASKVDVLFRGSGLFRPKWDERHYGDGRTYGEATIASAIAACTEAVGTKTHATSKGGLPTIKIVAGELQRAVNDGEAALLAARNFDPLYQRGGVLVRVVRLEAETVRRGFKRGGGALVIQVVEVPALLERLTTVAVWMKWDGRIENWVRTDCPEKIARTLGARGKWNLLSLVGIIETPTLRPDGSILSTPGYDEATGLFYDAGSVVFPLVKEKPTFEDAQKALRMFEDLLSGFPFVDVNDEKLGSDFAVALSAILTALVRRSIKSAPLHAFRAPKMGSGKSLLADVAALIATGRPCAVMSLGEDSNEERKRWLSVLLEGDVVVCIDNIERPLGGSALCSILTQETYKDRILGMSKTISVSTAVTLLATGNNLLFEGDLTTRVIPCDLDPGVERPEEREFQVNLYDYIPANRGELVAAGLTILRAYVVAGRPKMRVAPFGRFEEWDGLIRGALLWLGVADPCAGRQRIESADPTRQRLGQLLAAWQTALPGRPATVAEAVRLASDSASSLAGDAQAGASAERLREALAAVASDRSGAINPRYVGSFLSKYEKRIENGLRFVKGPQRDGVASWAVESVKEVVSRVSRVGSDARAKSVGVPVDSFGGAYGNDPANPGNPSPQPCPSCRGNDFWKGDGDVVVCRRCHPPSEASS